VAQSGFQQGIAQPAKNSERNEYAEKIRETYNFRFGKDKLSAPGNASVEATTSSSPARFPKQRIAPIVTSRLIASGARRCIQTRFERRFIGPA
jgi:hypothetical protein